MVLRYYKLREQPFGVTPDSRYLYSSATHREALASMLYAIDSGLGFVTLIAKPGMGKTTLIFETLRRLQDKARTVFLFQTIGTPIDLVRALLIDLGVSDTQGSLVDLQSKLNQILVDQAATGKRLVVVIDEAQNLDDSVLELVRMLSNFETARAKLMQIVLSGQPQLRDKLASPQLLQLRQRISIFAYLEPLSVEDTSAYIDHRLRVAGYSANTPLFTSGAVTLIAKHSEGIPRNINNICFNALSLGCALERTPINADVIMEVLADLNLQSPGLTATVPPADFIPEAPRVRTAFDSPAAQPAPSRLRYVAAIAALALAGGGFWFGYHRGESAGAPIAATYATPSNTTTATSNPVRNDSSPVAPATAPINGGNTTQPFSDPGTGSVPAAATASVPPSTVVPSDNQPTGPIDSAPATQPTPDMSPSAAASLPPATAPPTADTVPMVASPTSSSPATVQTRWIRVRQGQTLQRICAQMFGMAACGPESLRKIQRLNPDLIDPDDIHRGQRIRLPVSRVGLLGNE